MSAEWVEKLIKEQGINPRKLSGGRSNSPLYKDMKRILAAAATIDMGQKDSEYRYLRNSGRLLREALDDGTIQSVTRTLLNSLMQDRQGGRLKEVLDETFHQKNTSNLSHWYFIPR